MNQGSDPASIVKAGAATDNCSSCKNWLCQRVTDYEDGTRIINFKSSEGKGYCEILKQEFDGDFGCKAYVYGLEHIEIMGKKTGSPWHHSTRITCPDCRGTGVVGPLGDITCEPCCRSGMRTQYDDGYIADERTRRHPNEAVIGPPPQPTCPSCNAGIERHWKACPNCGNRLEKEQSARVEKFDDINLGGV